VTSFLAYQVLGDGPIDLVLVPPGASHLDHWWDLQGMGSWLRQLASFGRFIIFDKRGNGLSDRCGGTASMDERVDDLHAVMDAAGSERAVLYGVSEGGPMSIVFAAAHPERTLGLILYSTGSRLTPTTTGARLVVLPGQDHIAALSGARAAVLPVEDFLRDLEARDVTDRVLATVLFTDIVGSTAHAAASTCGAIRFEHRRGGAPARTRRPSRSAHRRSRAEGR
jgi:pimeloyl-ACP methyl ester carboxylesterase